MYKKGLDKNQEGKRYCDTYYYRLEQNKEK